MFVINEWLWADIEDTGARHTEAAMFVGAFFQSTHQLVMVLESKFDRKALASCKSENPNARLLAVRFLNRRFDLERCMLLRTGELAELTPQLAARVNKDDHYLVRALLTVEGSVLVTHDSKLRQALADAGLSDRCLTREEFLEQNFGIHSKAN